MSTESRELLDNWARHYSISPSAMEALHSVLSTREALAHSRAQDSGGEAFGWWLVDDNGVGRFSTLVHPSIIRDYQSKAGFQAIPLYTAAEQPAKGEDEYPRDVAMLLDSNAWTVHPESMSHDEAGSLWVWAQDAAAALRKYATPQPSDPSDAEKWGQQYRCGCFLGFPTKRAIPASCPQHMRDKQGGALPLDATPPTAQRHDEVGLPGNVITHRNAWRKAIELAITNAAEQTEDTDDAGYWRHELAAFDRTFDRLWQLSEAEKRWKLSAHGAGAAVEAVDAFGRTGPLLKGWDRLAREEGRPGHSRLTWAQAAADLRQVQMRNAALSTQPLLSDQPGGVSEGVEEDESTEYKCGGCGKAIHSYDNDWQCRACGCVTAERIRRRAVTALHPEQAKDGDVSNDNR